MFRPVGLAPRQGTNDNKRSVSRRDARGPVNKCCPPATSKAKRALGRSNGAVLNESVRGRGEQAADPGTELGSSVLSREMRRSGSSKKCLEPKFNVLSLYRSA